MTSSQINNIVQRIYSALAEYSYSVAFAELDSLVEATASSWEIKSEVAKLHENYNLMQRFALDGYADESRAKLLDQIVTGIHRVVDLVKRHQLEKESPSIYFSTLRFFNLKPQATLTSLVDEVFKQQSDIAMLMYSNPSREKQIARHAQLEQAQKDLFDKLWVTYPLTDDDACAVMSVMESEAMPDGFKQMLLGALLLGGLQYSDSRRMQMLADVYLADAESNLAVAALCALLLLMWCHRNEPLSANVKNRMAHICDTDRGTADIRMCMLQFIRTFDTKRITREVNEQIIPKMKNLSPELEKLKDLQQQDFEGMLDDEPRFEDILKSSGLEDELKRLNDMQLEGADVMVSTFSHLKSFPFFHDVANWFRTFDADNSRVMADTPQGLGDIVEVLAGAPVLCDSDKYSMVFSLGNMPAEMQDMIKGQISEQGYNFAQAASEMYATQKREQAANVYMQNLYRFFNLYRRKGDFTNPLATEINLFEIEALAPALADSEMATAAGEFYLKYGYFKEALSAFSRLSEEEIFFSNDLLQKIGYCSQRIGDFKGAIDAYSKSELLDGRNKWTLRRLAYCYKALGNSNKALEYFKVLMQLLPDDLNLVLNAGHCYMELGDYPQAMKCYFKVEFLDENTTKALRPIAWCSLLSGDLDKAGIYLDKIMLDNPTNADYINRGHYLLAINKPREAAESYTKALEMMHRDFDGLRQAVLTDFKALKHIKVDPLVLRLVLDKVQQVLWT